MDESASCMIWWQKSTAAEGILRRWTDMIVLVIACKTFWQSYCKNNMVQFFCPTVYMCGACCDYCVTGWSWWPAAYADQTGSKRPAWRPRPTRLQRPGRAAGFAWRPRFERTSGSTRSEGWPWTWRQTWDARTERWPWCRWIGLQRFTWWQRIGRTSRCALRPLVLFIFKWSVVGFNLEPASGCYFLSLC